MPDAARCRRPRSPPTRHRPRRPRRPRRRPRAAPASTETAEHAPTRPRQDQRRRPDDRTTAAPTGRANGAGVQHRDRSQGKVERPKEPEAAPCDADTTRRRNVDGSPTLDNPTVLARRRPAPRKHRRAELLHRQVPDPAVPAADLPGRRHAVRHPLGGPRRDQRDRDRLRPQPERLLRGRASAGCSSCRRPGRCYGVDANSDGVEGPVQPGRRDLRRRALPEGRRRRQGPPRRDLRLQPRRLVRRLRAAARAA